MEDADFNGGMECAKVFPDRGGDAGLVESEEELFAEDTGKGQ